MNNHTSRVTVTGATGFLGVHLVRALLEKGVEVQVLVRNPERAKKLLPDSVEFVTCDLEKPLSADIKDVLNGCKAVIHAAGGYQASLQRGDHTEMLTHLNVDAAGELWQLAEEAGVERFITMGTAVSVSHPDDNTPGNEDAPVSEVVAHNSYLQAKLAMRKVLSNLAQDSKMRFIEILAGSMWGPGVTPAAAPFNIVDNFEHKRIPGVLKGGMMIVDVRDVAHAIATVVLHPDPAARYILGGRRVEMSELLPMLEKATGIEAPTRSIPNFIAHLVSWLKPENLSPQALRMLQAGTNVSSERAMKDLGFTMRPLDATIADTVDTVNHILAAK